MQAISLRLASLYVTLITFKCMLFETDAVFNKTGQQNLIFYVPRTLIDELSSTFYAEFRYVYRVFLSGRVSKIQRNLNV